MNALPTSIGNILVLATLATFSPFVLAQAPQAAACSSSVLSDANLSVQQRNKGVLLNFTDRRTEDASVDVDFQTIDPAYGDADIMRVVLQSTAAISEFCTVSIRYQRSESTRLKLAVSIASNVGELYRKGSTGKALEAFAAGVTHPDGSPFRLPAPLMERMIASFAIGKELSGGSALDVAKAQQGVEASSDPCPLALVATYYDRNGQITLDAKNVTPKPVTGARYQIEFEDAVGVKQDATFAYISAWTFVPGKQRTQSWERDYLHSFDKYLLWVDRVKFADGTVWTSNDKSCQVHSAPKGTKAR
jgi:hypothetical protein